MNNVVLIGRLTKDPELNYTEGGTAVCKFSVAVDRAKDGTDFIRIVAWDKTAENCGKYLAKGRQVGVLGRIQTGSYKDREGRTIYTTDIVADRVEFLSKSEKLDGFSEVDDLLPF